MKKLVAVLCIITLLLSISGLSLAEVSKRGVNINFAFASDEELKEAIEYIQNELNSRGSNTSTRSAGSNAGNSNKSEVGVKKTNSDGISFTVLSIKESNGSGYYKPENGNVFLLIEVEIANDSKNTVSVNSTFGFDATCDDYSVEYSFSAECAVNNSLSTGDVKAGRKLKGWKGFEVPKNWKEFILTFTPDVSLFGGGEEIEVIIRK